MSDKPTQNEYEDSLAEAIIDAMSMANVRKLYIAKGKEIARLENEVDRLEVELAHWKANHDAQVARNAILRDRMDLSPEQWAERVGYKEDAERYRWLRKQESRTVAIAVQDSLFSDCEFPDGDQLDAAIDAARRE